MSKLLCPFLPISLPNFFPKGTRPFTPNKVIVSINIRRIVFFEGGWRVSSISLTNEFSFIFIEIKV